MTDRKAMTSSALRRRRQQIKKERATLKRELAAIEAEMVGRKETPNYTKNTLFSAVSCGFQAKNGRS